MELYKKVILGGVFVGGLAGLSGCGQTVDDEYGNPIHRALNSPEKNVVLTSEPRWRWDGILVGTNIYITRENGEKALISSTKPYLKDIVVSDFNKDGTDDFILYFNKFSILGDKKTVSETYLSTGDDFNYEKSNHFNSEKRK